MTIFDYLVILIVGLSILLSAVRGLVRELLALGAWVAAFWAARTQTTALSHWMPKSLPGESTRYLAAFILIFLGVLLLCSLLSLFLSKIVHGVGLGGLDRLLGMLFGAVRGFLIVIVLVLAAGMTSLPARAFWQKAMLSTPLEAVAIHVRGWLPDDLAKRIQYE